MRGTALHTPETVRAFLEKELCADYGECESILRGMAKRKTAFRLNALKMTENTLSSVQKAVDCQSVDFLPGAFLTAASEREMLALSEAERGEIYLQSLSSMLPALALSPKAGEDILDMTAAPGGKTCQIASLTKNGAHITACEKDKVRAERLRYNLEKQGVRASVLVEDARNLSDFLRFDRILLDAPCSGSGTLDLGSERSCRAFSEELVKNCAALQKQLLFKAVNMLKTGGTLVYSTCSVLEKENGEAVRAALATKKVALEPISFPFMEKLPLLHGKNAVEGTLTVAPDEEFEGFYLAVLKKL